MFKFPVMIKPVDSSGSKGVKRIESAYELKKAYNPTISISRTKHVIIEKFIERGHKYMIGGDCFMLNDKVQLWGLLNCGEDEKANPLVPEGKSYPLMIGSEKIEVIHQYVQRVVDLLNIKLVNLIFN